MRTVEEIKELADWLENDYHRERIKLQNEDWTYYKDTFKVPFIKAPYKVSRLGSATDIVDSPVAHIITQHPQVYVEALSDADVALERARKRGAYQNHIADFLTYQSPQPYKELLKNLLARGDGWIHPVNNPSFNKDELFQDDIPIIYSIPDPIVVFGSPDERNGVPDYVVVKYKRYYRSVMNRYEHWANPKHRGERDKYVEWLAYFDKDIRYFEADGQPVLPLIDTDDYGIQPNILGFTPFVHCYSGYGKATPDGGPEELAVSRIRPVKGRIMLKTELASSLASQIKLYVHRRYDFIPTAPNVTLPKDFKYDLNYGHWNFIPFGIDVAERSGSAPASEAYNYLSMLDYEISKVSPPVMQGMGTGSSGRQDDISSKHGLAQYGSVIDNASTAWAMALGPMGLRILKNKDLGLLPVSIRASMLEKGKKVRGEITLKSEDIDDFHCVVKLKAADPIEDKAQAQIGTAKWQAGEIDWMTNLTEYQGKSFDEADEIINRRMAEDFVKNNPDLFNAMVMGMNEKLGIGATPVPQEALGPQGQMPGQQGPIPGQPGAQGGPPRRGNIKSIDALAKDADMQLAARGPRRSPGL